MNQCRHCHAALKQPFLDLGHAPPSNAYLTFEALSAPEITYPLRLHVCESCWLVQTEDYADPDALFSPDYAYFSSTSRGWLEHAARYCEMISERLVLTGESFVIEVASNDGYLLRNFVSAGVPCLGIEPTDSTADAAEAAGVPTMREFFGEALGRKLAGDGQAADLIIGNNVYAHVPEINDFTAGLTAALKPDGVVTLEFPHLARLIAECQFDTVYHEHYSYLSLYTVQKIFSAHGLRVIDVEELPTHGGSLRVYGCRVGARWVESDAVKGVLDAEDNLGIRTPKPYADFQPRADRTKNGLIEHLLKAKSAGRTVAAYGAAAKGNTLLNYAGVKPDLIRYVCDAANSKQGRFMPGSHIPIHAPSVLDQDPPDEILILPWNIAAEVRMQLSHLADRGVRFFVAVPQMREIF